MSVFLYTALDSLISAERETLKIAERLAPLEGSFGFKANLDYLLQKGIEDALRTLREFQRPVFADLKMWNGTRTMVDVAKQLVDCGIDCFNVYALADSLLPKVVRATEGTHTKVFGLTVLTHFNEAYCQKHFRRSLREAVEHFAHVAIDSGCHGIILPGTALDAVSTLETTKVVPGVRPVWYRDDRHEEEVEPRVAVAGGADILVCGSPIMKSINPVGALVQIFSEINEVRAPR